MSLTKISSRTIQPGSISSASLNQELSQAISSGGSGGSIPIVSNVQVSNSSYGVLDDTAVSLSGGYIVINGSGFGSNTQVLIDNTPASSVTRVSNTQLRAQVPAKSAGSYIMYVVNSDTGATAIRINAITYSGTPTWSTGSTLSTEAVDEPVSIQLDATSDTSVTYQLQTGSTLPSGLTLAANGLLSGVVTGITQDTVYNFTIEAIDEENQDSPRSFSITITAGDRYINSVVLALRADSNTFITDASNNSFVITPNGDTRPSAFSPYNTSWSNYFDGTGDYLTTPGDSSLVLDDDFTIEFFMYLNSLSIAGVISSNHTSFTGTAFATIISHGTASNKISFWVQNISSSYMLASSTLTTNQWYHVSFVRSSGTIKLYLNGTEEDSYLTSGTITLYGGTGSLFRIGQYWNGSLNGHISDLRIVKGSAVYTSNFTPPTTPLIAISGTSLLTCQSNRLIDNSTNNFTITKNGDVRVTSFGPFAETDTATGSGYFDGTGDYLTAPANAAYNFGSDNFTVEFWFNRIAPKGQLYHDHILGNRPTSFSAGQWHIYVGPSAGSAFAFQARTPSGDIALSGGVCVENSWMHIAVVRNGTDLRLYVNGISVSSTTTSTTIGDSTSTFSVGAFSDGAYPCVAYISDIRMVKGTAVYTSNFTPPTSPLTAISGTSLLTLQNRISYNNSQPVDESGSKNIITRNGNASVGSYTPHTPAGWSAYFDGTGDYLTLTSGITNQFDPGSAFTLEGWINIVSGTNNVCFEVRGSSNSFDVTNGILFRVYSNFSGDTYFQFNSGGSAVSLNGTAPANNTWAHIAIGYDGTTTRLWINGTSVGTSTSTYTKPTYTSLAIGNNVSNLLPFNGYMSNWRFVKGTDVYGVSNISIAVPTTSLEPITNTSLLTLRGPSFTDDGPNRFAITRNGDTRITPFSPFNTHTIVPNGYSVYFDGVDDKLEVVTSADGAFDFGTGDFSVEAWAKSLDPADNDCVFNVRVSTYGLLLRTLNTTGWELYYRGASATTVSDPTVYGSSLTDWTHHAVIRESGVMKWYINGYLAWTGTNTDDEAYTTITIGQYSTPLWYGYLSNIRVVKGSSAYTGGTNVGDQVFTPPTGPFAASDNANTTFLACQSTSIIDEASNLTFTVTGAPQPTKYSLFGDTITTGVQYSPASHGGSYYFDGTGDYLLVPGSNNFVFDAGDFTIEAWINPSTTSVERGIVNNWQGGGAFIFRILSSNKLQLTFTSAASGINTVSLTATDTITPNAWSHVAVVRNGNSLYFYVNGVVDSGGPLSMTQTMYYYNGATKDLKIGTSGDTGNLFKGYISNLRIVKGSALYTSAFVPPAASPSPVAGTTLLLNGTGTAIADGVGKNVLETVGNARIINGIKKYGTGSMYFDGTGDYLYYVDSPNNQFGSGNLTWEMWINTTSSNQYATLYSRTPASFSTGMWTLLINVSSATSGDVALYMADYSSGAPILLTTGVNVRDGNWHHIAVVRNGSSWVLYVDGTSRATQTWSGTITDIAYGPYIGADQFYTRHYNGYIDDLRITKGVARYTSNFTPPTSSFQLR